MMPQAEDAQSSRPTIDWILQTWLHPSQLSLPTHTEKWKWNFNSQKYITIIWEQLIRNELIGNEQGRWKTFERKRVENCSPAGKGKATKYNFLVRELTQPAASTKAAAWQSVLLCLLLPTTQSDTQITTFGSALQYQQYFFIDNVETPQIWELNWSKNAFHLILSYEKTIQCSWYDSRLEEIMQCLCSHPLLLYSCFTKLLLRVRTTLTGTDHVSQHGWDVPGVARRGNERSDVKLLPARHIIIGLSTDRQAVTGKNNNIVCPKN